MLTFSTDTAKGKMLFDRANCNEGYDLYDIYTTFSQEKTQAWRKCLNKCLDEDGRHFRIIAHNRYGFSVAWDTREGVRIETPTNSYLIRDISLKRCSSRYRK